MDEFDEFDDNVNDEILAQLDAIEAKHTNASPEADDEFADPSLDAMLLHDLPPSNTSALHSDASDATSHGAISSASGSSGLVQQGLWGQAVLSRNNSGKSSEEYSSQVQASQGQVSLAPQDGFGISSDKIWDHRAFLLQNRAKLVQKNPKNEQDALEEHLRTYKAPPMKLCLDQEQAKTWIYPVNKPLRTYQLNIVKKALFEYVSLLTQQCSRCSSNRVREDLHCSCCDTQHVSLVSSRKDYFRGPHTTPCNAATTSMPQHLWPSMGYRY